MTHTNGHLSVAEVIGTDESALLEDWLAQQLAATTRRADLISEADLRSESGRFLSLVREALASDADGDMDGAPWDPVRGLLGDISRSRATAGFTASETATFVFSLKQPLFDRLRAGLAGDPDALTQETWTATVLLDKLGLVTFESYSAGREEVIARQQREVLELSTPVVKVWDGILALPMIGVLDSGRTQSVMETLLDAIVKTESRIAIIDITGVPTVDTLVAQHLLRTVAAARLMGAECIVSGVRPQIAQTIVHLGIELDGVITKASLADAVALALDRLGHEVVAKHSAG